MRPSKSAARAPFTRRATEVRSADDLGALDPAAIERVRQEAWPIANTSDEMYDALMVAGYLKDNEPAGIGRRSGPSSARARSERKRVVCARAPERRPDRNRREPYGSPRPGDRARARDPRSGARFSRSRARVAFCAAGSRPVTSCSGAIGGCSRASTATRSTACVPRSNRCRRRTSCASCSTGSTWPARTR